MTTTPGGSRHARGGDKRRLVPYLGRSAPRSRSGCTTCKRRKVRCDETFPICANCTRLGAECIYQRIQRRKHPSPTNESTHSSQQNAGGAEKGAVEVADQRDDQNRSDTDLGMEPELHSGSTLFFDFEAFSRNAMDLWCSPTTALPEIPYPEAFGTPGFPALDEASHDNTASAIPIETLAAVVRFPAPIILRSRLTGTNSRDQNQHCGSAPNREINKGQLQDPLTAPDHQPLSSGNNQDAHLLRDIVPSFEHMATNMLLAPYCRTDNVGEDSMIRRSDALGVYFQEQVFVPTVTTIDPTSWRSLCCQILTMARKSSIISNGVVALSQLHFMKFAQTAQPVGSGSQPFRNGQTLTQYLYIFAKEKLVNGLEVLKSSPTMSLRRELLIALFLLTCFELIDKEDIHRAQQIEWADYLLQEYDQSDFVARQVINWLLLCDVKLVVYGGNGILPRKPPPVSPVTPCNRTPLSYTREPPTPHIPSPDRSELSPPPDRLQMERMPSYRPKNHPYGAAPTLKEGILRDAIYFHYQSQQFLRKIAMLDRHRRPRGSTTDEIEVTATAVQLVNDLHDLWNDRPALLDLEFEQLSQSLRIDLARDIYRTICIFRACFWSNFCYLYRAAWWDHASQSDEKSAADETWKALRGSVDLTDETARSQLPHMNVDHEPLLNTAAMWAMFTFATECSSPERVSWCIAKLRQLTQAKNSGVAGEHATIHAEKAERLLQEVVNRQLERGGRVDVRFVSLELFGFMFPII